MPHKYCCPECFGDGGLRDSIFPSLDPKFGKCDYCNTDDVQLVLPNYLSDYFESLVNIYEPSQNGLCLVEWMKTDWNLFTHERMDVAHAKELLGDILNDGEIVRKNFSPSSAYQSEGLARWETLRDEMMYCNRWFLDTVIDTVRLYQLLEVLVVEDLPELWFRARICNGDEMYSIEKMGPPPKRIATNGRANPAGIPYLYLSSKPEAATAEIRPHTGEVACVADFLIPKIRAVDLRDPRTLVSPFIWSETSEIGQLRADLPFLERLGDELTRPVLPHGTAIDYIPSQYICEFIKKKGFDGVIYRSSVSDGINLALFDPSKAQGGTVELYNVSKVLVEVERV